MLVETMFWIAACGALALRSGGGFQSPLIHIAALASACAAVLALTGAPFAQQFLCAGGLLLIGTGLRFAFTRHAHANATPLRREARAREAIYGRVSRITDVGAKRHCLIESEGRVLAGVAVCFEPIEAGDEVRLIGQTREGTLVQLRYAKPMP